MILLLDNYDSFTYNLYDYLLSAGAEVEVKRNDEMEERTLPAYDGLVISPGPATPSESGRLMPLLAEAIHKMPVLGICLGFQAIGEYFGAKLIQADIPVHGKVSMLTHTGDLMFTGIPEKFNACRYHSLVLSGIKPPLVITASTDGKIPMAFRHHLLPVWGLQYHPEAILTSFGHQILFNWLKYCLLAEK